MSNYNQRSFEDELVDECVGIGKLFFLLVPVLAASLLGAGISVRYDHKLQERVKQVVDRNNDGVVSREEFGFPILSPENSFYLPKDSPVDLRYCTREQLERCISAHQR